MHRPATNTAQTGFTGTVEVGAQEAETKAGGAAAQERKVLEGDSKAEVTAPAQQGTQQKQLNMAGRTAVGSREDAPTSCPGIRQAQTHSTNPTLCDCMSKRWQERQVLCTANTQSRKFGEIQKKVGRNGIMTKEHKEWLEAVLQFPPASVHLGQKQCYNHCNTRSQLLPCISQGAWGELYLGPRQLEDKQESLLKLCSKGRGTQDPEVPR